MIISKNTLSACSVRKGTGRSPIALLCGFGFATQMNHPACQAQGELTQVFISRRGIAAQQFNTLGNLDPIAGSAAKGLAHVGHQGHSARSRSFSRRHHERCQELCIGALAQEGARARFNIQHQGIQSRGQLLTQDRRTDQPGTLDGSGAIAQGVEDTIGGNQRRRLADDRRTAVLAAPLRIRQASAPT